MARFIPTSGTDAVNGGVFPYYASSSSADHPEPLVYPLPTATASSIDFTDGGLIGDPDPKQFDCYYDQVINMLENT